MLREAIPFLSPLDWNAVRTSGREIGQRLNLHAASLWGLHQVLHEFLCLGPYFMFGPTWTNCSARWTDALLSQQLFGSPDPGVLCGRISGSYLEAISALQFDYNMNAPHGAFVNQLASVEDLKPWKLRCAADADFFGGFTFFGDHPSKEPLCQLWSTLTLCWILRTLMTRYIFTSVAHDYGRAESGPPTPDDAPLNFKLLLWEQRC